MNREMGRGRRRGAGRFNHGLGTGIKLHFEENPCWRPRGGGHPSMQLCRDGVPARLWISGAPGDLGHAMIAPRGTPRGAGRCVASGVAWQTAWHGGDAVQFRSYYVEMIPPVLAAPLGVGVAACNALFVEGGATEERHLGGVTLRAAPRTNGLQEEERGCVHSTSAVGWPAVPCPRRISAAAWTALWRRRHSAPLGRPHTELCRRPRRIPHHRVNVLDHGRVRADTLQRRPVIPQHPAPPPPPLFRPTLRRWHAQTRRRHKIHEAHGHGHGMDVLCAGHGLVRPSVAPSRGALLASATAPPHGRRPSPAPLPQLGSCGPGGRRHPPARVAARAVAVGAPVACGRQ